MKALRHLLVAAALSVGIAAPAQAAGTDQDPPIRTEWMPCSTEDGINCVWDARHSGNGKGHSLFTSRKGREWRLPHHIAHTLIWGQPRRDYVACETPVSSDPVLCIWEERVWLNRSGNDWPIPASIGRYLLTL